MTMTTWEASQSADLNDYPSNGNTSPSTLLINPSRSAFTCHFPHCIHFTTNRYTALAQVSGRIADIAIGVECFRGLRLQYPLDTAHDVTQEEVILRRF